MIDFTLSPSQEAIRAKACKFSQEVLVSAYKTYEAPSNTTQLARFRALQPFYGLAVRAGFLKLLIPKPLGGDAGTLIEASLLVEELCKHDRSLSLTIFSVGLGLSALMAYGTKEQKEELLASFLSGEGTPLASLVLTEPEGVANWLEKGGRGLRTTARREGDEWVVNGEKIWATSCSGWDDRGADIQSVVCRLAQNGEDQDPNADPAASTMILLVTRDQIAKNKPDAYKVLKHIESTGHSSTAGPHVRFTEFRVPAHRLLGEIGQAGAIITRAFSSSAALAGAMATGVMAATFEAALDFAKKDSRGGATSLLARPTVSDLLMDIKMRTDASRFLVWKAANALEQGKGIELALEAKIFCSDQAVNVVVDAMKVVGVTSYDKDSPFPRLLNDAMCLPLTGGGNIGIRRRQLEQLFMADDYRPWASTYN